MDDHVLALAICLPLFAAVAFVYVVYAIFRLRSSKHQSVKEVKMVCVLPFVLLSVLLV